MLTCDHKDDFVSKKILKMLILIGCVTAEMLISLGNQQNADFG